MIKKFLNRQFISYIFFGILTTLVDFIVFYISNSIFNINYILSTIFGWILAVIFAYITNKFFVFNSNKKENILKEIFSFFYFRFLSLILSIIFMVLFIEILNINESISKIIVNIFVVLANYFFSKVFIFKKGEKDE